MTLDRAIVIFVSKFSIFFWGGEREGSSSESAAPRFFALACQSRPNPPPLQTQNPVSIRSSAR